MGMLMINLLLFFLTFWLGLYNLVQVGQDRRFWLTALAPLAFCAGRAAAILMPHSPLYSLTLFLVRLAPILLLLPMLCWLLVFWLSGAQVSPPGTVVTGRSRAFCYSSRRVCCFTRRRLPGGYFPAAAAVRP
jgi:hypothetical protein